MTLIEFYVTLNPGKTINKATCKLMMRPVSNNEKPIRKVTKTDEAREIYTHYRNTPRQ